LSYTVLGGVVYGCRRFGMVYVRIISKRAGMGLRVQGFRDSRGQVKY